MDFKILCLSCVLLISGLKSLSVQASEPERRLLHKLLDQYSNLERPVLSEADVLHVTMGLDFQQIIDVDEKNQMITSSFWIKLHWTDFNLVWNPADYGNLTDVRIHSDILWRPDVLLYNSADTEFSRFFKSNVIVASDGSCSFIPPGIFKSTCPISIGHFPFDEQRCKLKFGSWTYSALKLNLTVDPNYNEQPDASSYVQNGEWDLVGVPVKWNEFRYDCCPEPYVDLTFTIHVRRRSLFYMFNLVLPCALISSMTLLGFTLPPESGEKLTLAVTILLSLTVFLLVIADSMPATSDALPLVGIYFGMIMLMTSFSVVLTVVVLNFHYRTPNTHAFPAGWIRKILLEWLPFILRVKRQQVSLRESERGMAKQLACCCGFDWILPFSDVEKTFDCFPTSCVRTPKNEHICEERDSAVGSSDSATNFIENGLVLNQQPNGYHFRPPNGVFANSAENVFTFDDCGIPAQSPAWFIGQQKQKAPAVGAYQQRTNGCGDNGVQHTCARHFEQQQQLNNNVCCSGKHQHATGGEKSTFQQESKLPTALEEVKLTTRDIWHELQFVTDRMRSEDEHDGLCNDWKFAASVLDRLFLWLMTIFTIGFTLGVVAKAPSSLFS